MDKFSFLGNGDVSAVEDLFQQYIKDKSLNVKKEEDVVALVNYYNTVSQK